MIVAKFGGTATAPNNMKYVLAHVDDNVGAVVVSACGREFDGDDKVTDLLTEYYRERSEVIWARIENKFRRLCELNGVVCDVDELLADAHIRALKYGKAYCLSLGEELTAKIVACVSKRDYVEAAEYVVFRKDGSIDEKETSGRIATLCGRRFVVGGFYGATADGQRLTFSRGGGDVSGALFAVFMRAALYENFTDVDGVCVANPTKVFRPRVIDGLSYNQMRLMSNYGAEVLHPSSTLLPTRVGLPIVVRNFYGCGNGTTVSNAPCLSPMVAVTSVRRRGEFVCIVLHNMGCGAAEIAGALCKRNVGRVFELKCADNVLVVRSQNDLTVPLYEVFEQAGK